MRGKALLYLILYDRKIHAQFCINLIITIFLVLGFLSQAVVYGPCVDNPTRTGKWLLEQYFDIFAVVGI